MWRLPRFRVPLKASREINGLFSFGTDNMTFSSLVAGLLVAGGAFLLAVVVWPVIAVVVEAVVLIGASLALLALTITSRKPWQVYAAPTESGQPEYTWQVSGWRASRRAMAKIADSLRSGGPISDP